MPIAIKSLLDKLSLAIKGCFLILKQWQYLALTVAASVVITGLLYAIINWSSVWPLISSPLLPFVNRLTILADLPRLAIVDHGLIIAAVALIQGAAVALLIYNTRTNQKIDSKSMSGSVLASAVASLGLGCSVCGTSLLLPIIGLFGASGMYAAADTLAFYINLFALIIGILALLRLGYISYINHQSQTYLKSKAAN
ncbi:hypothetical protein GX865_00865 [Candidatus Saccharibacteria bacterium]|jgi:hypothetical protein|nr:hypothetical protein [Candidatus Saccharibacteria bacterium]